MCRKHSGKRNRCHGYVFREVFGVIVFSFTVGVAQNLLDMFTKPKLLAVGASVGILLPKEMLVRMKITKGDTLFAVEMPEGYSWPVTATLSVRWRSKAPKICISAAVVSTANRRLSP